MIYNQPLQQNVPQQTYQYHQKHSFHDQRQQYPNHEQYLQHQQYVHHQPYAQQKQYAEQKQYAQPKFQKTHDPNPNRDYRHHTDAKETSELTHKQKDTKKSTEINDGYHYVERTDNLLASRSKRTKQNDSNKNGAKMEIMKNLTAIKRYEETDQIQKCIGQVTISRDGGSTYRYGTGTVYKQLHGKYYLVITCAHNLVYFNDKANKKENAQKLFYLPNGVKDESVRLVCVEWIAHEKYDPNRSHCPYDIGLILCYDPTKYYKKQNINVNEFVSIDKYKKQTLKRCNIFGYPVKCEGQLMGKFGTANKDQEYDEWK
eukprot:427411_1